MPLELKFETRHTDTFAATPFVHAGVLLALTELMYARIEAHLNISKPPDIVAVERETRAIYIRPLHWQEGASVRARTVSATTKGFTLESEILSATLGSPVASFTHDWIWLDSKAGRRVDIPDEVITKLSQLG